MKRLLLALSIIAPATGCFTLTPVGPITKGMKMPTPTDKLSPSGDHSSPLSNKPATPDEPNRPSPAPIGGPASDTPAAPAVIEAPAPPKPAHFISPDDVTPATAQDALQRLNAEIEQDAQSARQIQPPADVSVIPSSRR